MLGLFNTLNTKNKVDFFVHCQKLLIENHPNSPFLFRKDNAQTRLHHVRSFVNNYKGLFYRDDHVCALFNKIMLTDPKDPEHSVKVSMYQPPTEHYNAIIIDFVVFRDIKDCVNFVRYNYDPKVQHVLFVRHNKVKVYPVLDIIQQVLHLPIV